MNWSPLPETVGPFVVKARLGRGGMGEVFLGIGPDNTLVAVKVIRSEYEEIGSLRIRLEREATAMRMISHARVAELLYADLNGARPYLATRYVKGRTLAEHVEENGPLAGARAWDLAHGLAEALVAIHQANLLHRDLKPGNVLMTENGPIVIDFGIAHIADATRLTYQGDRAPGTPAYMAPESADSRSVGAHSDVFSWAATMTFAVTGRTATWPLVSRREWRAVLGDAPGLPPELRSCILRAARRKPGRRPTAPKLEARLAALRPRRGGDLHRRVTIRPRRLGRGIRVPLPGGAPVTVDVPAEFGARETVVIASGRGRRGSNGGPPGDAVIHLEFSPRTLLQAVLHTTGLHRLKVPAPRRLFLSFSVLLTLGAPALAVWALLQPAGPPDGSGGPRFPTSSMSTVEAGTLKVTFTTLHCSGRRVFIGVRNDGSGGERYSIARDGVAVFTKDQAPHSGWKFTFYLKNHARTVLTLRRNGAVSATRTYSPDCPDAPVTATASPSPAAIPEPDAEYYPSGTELDGSRLRARLDLAVASLVTGPILFWFIRLFPGRLDRYPGGVNRGI